ncbi:MAG: hypothetical protein JOY61_04395 [Chloroflexi bacterium]|nr:hypothetical protein [Chloroflexota bacterium]
MPTVAESRFLDLVPTCLIRLNANAEAIARGLDRSTQAINLLTVVVLHATGGNRNVSEAVQRFREFRSALDC